MWLWDKLQIQEDVSSFIGQFLVVSKFILLMLDDLKLSPIKYNKECKYLHNLDDQNDDQVKENMRFTFYCAKLRPYMAFYKMQINVCNTSIIYIIY